MSRLSKFKSYLSEHRLIKIVLQLLLVVLVYLLVRSYQLQSVISGTAPEINATLIDGSSFDLHAESAQPVLLRFWASWCPICEFENSNYAALSKDYRVVNIAVWSGTDLEVENYLYEQQLSMPVLVDNEGELARLYGVKGVPVSFFINNGEIVTVERGYTSETGLRLRMWWLTL